MIEFSQFKNRPDLLFRRRSLPESAVEGRIAVLNPTLTSDHGLQVLSHAPEFTLGGSKWHKKAVMQMYAFYRQQFPCLIFTPLFCGLECWLLVVGVKMETEGRGDCTEVHRELVPYL
jgi:hypothetical protein